MSRVYTAKAKELTVAASLEIFSMYMNTNNCIAKLRRLVVSMTQVTLPTAQGLEFILKRFSSPTQITSGTAITPDKEDSGDAASAATVYAGNASVSSGTLNWEWDDGCYLYTGRDIVFAYDLIIPRGQLLSVYCPSAPTGSPTPVINAMLEWEEQGV